MPIQKNAFRYSICRNSTEKITAPALPPAPIMPDTVPVTFGLRYGTTPNVAPSALSTNRLKVIKAAIAPGRVWALEKNCAPKLCERRRTVSKIRDECKFHAYHYKNTCPCGIDECLETKEKKEQPNVQITDLPGRSTASAILICPSSHGRRC